MQKKLIALAIAGFSGAAFAQSNVTVYGVVDLTQESVKAEGASGAGVNKQSVGRLSSNSSYIGFRGTEDLGGGLKAVWQIENGLVPDNTAAGAWNNRDSFVGLNGGFGSVLLGNLTSPMRLQGAKVDFNPGASSIAFSGNIFGTMNGAKLGTDDRTANAVTYISPSFGGFTVMGLYGNGENKTAAGNSKVWELGAAYDQGPVYVSYVHRNADDFTNAAGTALFTTAGTVSAAGVATAAVAAADSEIKADRIAGTFTFGATKVSALWDQQKVRTTTNGETKRKAWMVGAAQSFGANTVYLEYAKADELEGGVLGVADTGAKQFTLGYTYAMSKRTMAHAYFTKITNESAAKYDFYVPPLGIAPALGADPQGFGVGLRHTF